MSKELSNRDVARIAASMLEQIENKQTGYKVRGIINGNFHLLKKDLETRATKEEVQELKTPYFKTIEELKAARPNPTPGDKAWIGDPYPGTVWNYTNANKWEDTKKAPAAEEVNLEAYTPNGGTQKTGKQLEDGNAENYNYISGIVEKSKNLFNKANLIKGLYVSFHDTGVNGIKEHENSALFVFYGIKENTDYTLSGIYKGWTHAMAFYTNEWKLVGGKTPPGSTANITTRTSDKCSIIAMTVYFNTDVDLEKYTEKLQLEEGSVATAYVPFLEYREVYRKPEVDKKIAEISKLEGSYNKVDCKIGAKKGYWHWDTGEFVVDNGYICGEYFPKGDEIMYLEALVQWMPYAILYMDKDGKVIDRYYKQNSSTPAPLKDYRLLPPSKTHSIRISGLATFSNILSIYRPSNGSILWGKRWAACGDSITAAADKEHISADPLTGEQLGYVERIGKRNHMEYFNFAKGGGYLSYKANHHYCFANSDENANYGYPTYKQLPDDLDYITIWFGINDSWYGEPAQNDKHVGTLMVGVPDGVDENGDPKTKWIPSTDNTTFYGAYNLVLDYLIRKYPTTKIMIVVTHGITAKYRKAIRDVAQKWGVGCLDLCDGSTPLWLSNDTGLIDPSIMALRIGQFAYDGQHPNDAGYEAVYPIVENKMCGL